MNNSDFLSFFSGLSNSNTKEQIISNANNIINCLSLHQNEEISSEKYIDYIHICDKPSEELLYTIRRLIGGLGSTGVEYRKGFAFALYLLLKKFGSELKIKELLIAVIKETYVSKNEKNHIKVCSYSGKNIIFRIIASVPSLNIESILFILKQVKNIANFKYMEESSLYIINELLGRIFSNYYTQIQKENKLYDEVLKFLDPICKNKNLLNKTSSNFEFAIYFILLNHTDKFKGFLPKNIIQEFFEIDANTNESESPLKVYFEILLSLPNKNGTDFNFSFTLLCKLLENLKEVKYAYKIWNTLIDPECIGSFKKISSKNFELLLFRYSEFLLSKFFSFNYVSQIFDDSFFISLLHFSSNKRQRYANVLTELISNEISTNKSLELKKVHAFCRRLLNIFGVEQEDKYSLNSLNNFFIFLLSSIDKKARNKYIDSLISDDFDNIDNTLFHISALKIILFNNIEIDQEYHDKIVEYFLIKFYTSSPEEDAELDSIINERTLHIILSLIKPNVVNGELVQMKYKKSIKVLTDLHKKVQMLLKHHKLHIGNNKYIEYFKELTKKVKDIKGKLITKLGLIILLFYLKSDSEFQQEMDDIISIKKFENKWTKVYTDLTIGLIHKGNNSLIEFAIGIYLRMSKYIGKGGVDVIIEFLKEQKKKKESKFNYDESDEDDK